ncbi:MAG TPA: TolC family protein [Planctomicrobium sp.]|nr:TolC family protein [Planctomicrobium sp.]
MSTLSFRNEGKFRRLRRWKAISAAILMSMSLTGGSGCSTSPNYRETIGNDTTHVNAVMRRVDEKIDAVLTEDPLIEPHTLEKFSHKTEQTYRDLTLSEAVSLAMTNSEVLRDLGATVLRAPEVISTRYRQGIQQTDPRFGMEAALSAFDAQFTANTFFRDNHQTFNNEFFAGGTNLFNQDASDYLLQLSKRTATGATISLRNLTDYDSNNAPANMYSSVWQNQVEAEIRQPLLQGGGLTFNRIAGPGAIPGVYNGVLIAKVNQDISQADFEKNVRNYISDVVNSYWDLYFAYRDLDAKQGAFERSRETWQAYQAMQTASLQGGVSEALAREQFYRFQSELQDSITGRAGQRTQVGNGASGGVFRGTNGVQLSERRLRLLIGLPITETELLRPNDEPEIAPVVFDWGSVIGESLRRRPELTEQRLLVKRRELELIASKNFLSPQLDAVAKYRARGIGHNFAGGSAVASNGGVYGSAMDQLGTFENREWMVGMEFSVPLGFRRAHAAVDNAEFLLARSRAVLKEQERQVIHDLGTMVAETSRAYEQTHTTLNRYLAASDAVDSLDANRKAGLPVNLDQVLDAQRRLMESQTQHFQARVEYAIALKNVHFEKGSLFEYTDVALHSTSPQIISTVHSMELPTEAPPVEPAVDAQAVEREVEEVLQSDEVFPAVE